MEQNGTLTEADILSEIIDPAAPTLSEDAARALLRLRFGDATVDRIRSLLQRNTAGTGLSFHRGVSSVGVRHGSQDNGA